MSNAIYKSSMFKDPTTWTMIVVAIVCYVMSAVPYMHKHEMPKHNYFYLIWAGLFTLYTIGSILLYRAITKRGADEEEDCYGDIYDSDYLGAQDASKVCLLMFILLMLSMLAWSYAHCIMKSHLAMTFVSLMSLCFLAAQMILGWIYAKSNSWPCFLILPLFVWILIFGVAWSACKAMMKQMMKPSAPPLEEGY